MLLTTKKEIRRIGTKTVFLYEHVGENVTIVTWVEGNGNKTSQPITRFLLSVSLILANHVSQFSSSGVFFSRSLCHQSSCFCVILIVYPVYSSPGTCRRSQLDSLRTYPGKEAQRPDRHLSEARTGKGPAGEFWPAKVGRRTSKSGISNNYHIIKKQKINFVYAVYNKDIITFWGHFFF